MSGIDLLQLSELPLFRFRLVSAVRYYSVYLYIYLEPLQTFAYNSQKLSLVSCHVTQRHGHYTPPLRENAQLNVM